MADTRADRSGEPSIDQREVVTAIAHKVDASERAVRRFLDRLLDETLAGNRQQVRSELREFGQENPFLFKTLSFATNNIEQFFDDLRAADVPDHQIEILSDLGETYRMLGQEFNVVLAERRSGMEIPI